MTVQVSTSTPKTEETLLEEVAQFVLQGEAGPSRSWPPTPASDGGSTRRRSS